MEKIKNDTTGSSETEIRRDRTAQYLKEFSNAIKNASASIKGFGYEYKTTDSIDRETIANTTDQFVKQLVKAWELLRIKILEF